MMEVIAAAALNAIFREGYAFSSGPGIPFSDDTVGGIWARCNKHSVVLWPLSRRITIRDKQVITY